MEAKAILKNAEMEHKLWASENPVEGENGKYSKQQWKTLG